MWKNKSAARCPIRTVAPALGKWSTSGTNTFIKKTLLFGVALSLVMFVACRKNGENSQRRVDSVSETNRLAARQLEANNTSELTEGQMSAQHAYLELIILNGTSGDIDETAIILDRHSCTFGIVGMGYSKGYLDWTHPVGTNAMVRWRESNGTKRESNVGIADVYDPTQPGHLTFTIAGTNVTVKFSRIKQ